MSDRYHDLCLEELLSFSYNRPGDADRSLRGRAR